MRDENENVANVIRYKAHYLVESEWIDENSVSNDYDYESNEGVIVLKDGVTEIGEGAFTESFDIVSVEIPNAITTIGMGAFAYSVISSVVIPNSVTEISEGAFNGCDELKSIYIPASVERIGVEAFLNCTKLNSIEVDKSNLVYDSRENCNAIIETRTNPLPIQLTSTSNILRSTIWIAFIQYLWLMGLLQWRIFHSTKFQLLRATHWNTIIRCTTLLLASE